MGGWGGVYILIRRFCENGLQQLDNSASLTFVGSTLWKMEIPKILEIVSPDP